MTTGFEVESSMNLTCSAGGEDSTWSIRWWSGGKWQVFILHMFCSLNQTFCRAGQVTSICSKSPITSLQVSESQYPSLLLLDQNLHMLSVRYLPLVIRVRILAGGAKIPQLSTSQVFWIDHSRVDSQVALKDVVRCTSYRGLLPDRTKTW